MKETDKKYCGDCVNFFHALEAMTDHVTAHTCTVHGGKINIYDRANSCTYYKRKKK